MQFSRGGPYDLASRLAGIRPGTADWPAYEKYCEDLLSFLFVPPLNPLNPPILQSRDERHVNRRDYILPNYAADYSFWQFMRTHYEAHLVVAEVKNLSRGPGKNEILQVANYLNSRGTGLFALILARTDLDQVARWICREQWVHDAARIRWRVPPDPVPDGPFFDKPRIAGSVRPSKHGANMWTKRTHKK